MPATIECRIDREGKIHLDVHGVQGANCEDITRCLTEALGDVEDVQRKPDYFVELDGVEQHVHEE